MPRYIDAKKIRYSWMLDDDGRQHDGVTLQSVVDKTPTEDVVPRVEFAHEIFKDIEECLDGTNILYTSDLIELKKKYTGDVVPALVNARGIVDEVKELINEFFNRRIDTAEFMCKFVEFEKKYVGDNNG